jgi:hypothetical protein
MLVASSLLGELFKHWKQFELPKSPQASGRIQTWIGALKSLPRPVRPHYQHRTFGFSDVAVSVGVKSIEVVVD